MFLTHAASAIEIIAHRGYSQKAPENTVSAFNLAWENKTDACELDMYLTKDGKVVIIHDKDTKRTCGGVQLDVAGSTLEELRKLDAGSWKDPKYAGEKLPTLEEALATMPLGNNKRFFLEIKCGPEVVPAVAAILEPMRARADQLVIISFKLEACAAAKKALPWVKNYLIVGGNEKDKAKTQRKDVTPFIEQAKTAGLDGLDLDMAWAWTPALVKQVRDAGLGVFVWTVDKPDDIARFKALGVDGITTNEPVVVRQELAKP
jgi:glycerophosphoryl diester phosphodiesterase